MLLCSWLCSCSGSRHAHPQSWIAGQSESASCQNRKWTVNTADPMHQALLHAPYINAHACCGVVPHMALCRMRLFLLYTLSPPVLLHAHTCTYIHNTWWLALNCSLLLELSSSQAPSSCLNTFFISIDAHNCYYVLSLDCLLSPLMMQAISLPLLAMFLGSSQLLLHVFSFCHVHTA